jgi:hypothetical protein
MVYKIALKDGLLFSFGSGASVNFVGSNLKIEEFADQKEFLNRLQVLKGQVA